MNFITAIGEWADEMMGRILVWLIGNEDRAGAAERAWPEAKRQAWMVLYLLTLGILVPIAAIAFGLLVAWDAEIRLGHLMMAVAVVLGFLLFRWRRIAGVVVAVVGVLASRWFDLRFPQWSILEVDTVGIAQAVMFLGLMAGFAVLFVIGGAMATAVDILARVFRNTPKERVVRVLRAYLSLLVWMLFVGDLAMIWGVNMTFRQIAMLSLAGIGIALITLTWPIAINWGRPLVLGFFLCQIIWIFVGTTIQMVPSGVWIDTTGVDVKSRVSQVGAAHNQREIDRAVRVETSRRRALASEELAMIRERLANAATYQALQDARAEYAEWERRYSLLHSRTRANATSK